MKAGRGEGGGRHLGKGRSGRIPKPLPPLHSGKPHQGLCLICLCACVYAIPAPVRARVGTRKAESLRQGGHGGGGGGFQKDATSETLISSRTPCGSVV